MNNFYVIPTERSEWSESRDTLDSFHSLRYDIIGIKIDLNKILQLCGVLFFCFSIL